MVEISNNKIIKNTSINRKEHAGKSLLELQVYPDNKGFINDITINIWG
jgi:hypothetical protein